MRVPWTKGLRDSATLQVAALVNAGGNVLSTVGLAHLLGAREQGRYYVAVYLYSLLWFAINLAVVQATVSQVAAANARDQRAKVAGWIAFLAKAYFAMGLVLVSVGPFALPWISELVSKPTLAPDPTLAHWAWWLTLTPILELPRVVLGAALQGTRNMRPLAQSENTQELVRVFLVLVGAIATRSIAGPIVGTLAASAVGSIVAIELYRNAARAGDSRLPSFREIARELGAVPVRRGLPLGAKLGFLRSSDAVAFEILPGLVLERFASSEWVAYLRIAQRLMGIPMMFMQGVSRMSLPKLSEYAGKKDMVRFRESYLRMCGASSVAITCALFAMLACVPWIVERFLPRDYVEPVFLLCKILLPGFALLSLSVANEAFYVVTNTLRVGLILCAIGLVVALSSIALAARYPTTGAAWGLTLTRMWTATNFLFALWYFRRARAVPPPAAPALQGPSVPAPDERG